MKKKNLQIIPPLVMGILNITPDSFFSHSRIDTTDRALGKASELIEQGADLLDIGAYSSRPGAEHIPTQQELDRLIPVVEVLSKAFPTTPLSVDTFRAAVAEAAVNAGADIINDISGGDLDSKMFETAAKLQVPYILMHMKGTPQSMTEETHYESLLQEMMDYFTTRIAKLTELGVKNIILDPGFGFAKTTAQSFGVLQEMAVFQKIGRPMLAGLSRKSMIYKTLEITAHEALNGTTVLNTMALMNGASILRVHDVREAKECVKLFEMLKNNAPN